MRFPVEVGAQGQELVIESSRMLSRRSRWWSRFLRLAASPGELGLLEGRVGTLLQESSERFVLSIRLSWGKLISLERQFIVAVSAHEPLV